MSDPDSPPYKISEHSGDLKIQAWGRDCLEALVNASLGLVNQIVTLDCIEESDERSIIATGNDDEERYIAFLNEILFLVYTKHWLPKRVRLMRQCLKTGCREIEAVLVGEPLILTKHEIKYDIKAVTYHNFRIRKAPELVTLEFVCDL
jgi:SHS2 domain-containing protein